MMYKNLNEYVAEGDYSGFMAFIQSSKISNISAEDEYDFYTNAPAQWAEMLISVQAPSRRGEKAIIKYQNKEVLSLVVSLWKFYPRTILWAFREGTAEEAEKVLYALNDKPSSEAEVAMLRRGELELFKLWLEKFGELEDEAEKLINEDPNLASIKSHYIDWELSR